ncbi:hypothetical protein BDR04DRAFT_1145142 [Suillus decipiens]|nr:hypothetical protein BDR04DRAFT_1145142 [Suillus decipiens]
MPPSPPQPETLPDQIHNSINPQVHVPFIPDHSLELKIQDNKLEDPWQHDPVNPRNWSAAKKWTTIAIVALYTFVTPLASSIMAPGLPDFAIKYGITNLTVIALTLSIFLLSFTIGPLFAARLSKVYGCLWFLGTSPIHYDIFSYSPKLALFVSPFVTFTQVHTHLQRSVVGPVMGGFIANFICFILSLYMALIYSIYYLMFTTFPDLFSTMYYFSIGIGGLPYLGIGIGFLSATIFGTKVCDKTYLYLRQPSPVLALQSFLPLTEALAILY